MIKVILLCSYLQWHLLINLCQFCRLSRKNFCIQRIELLRISIVFNVSRSMRDTLKTKTTFAFFGEFKEQTDSTISQPVPCFYISKIVQSILQIDSERFLVFILFQSFLSWLKLILNYGKILIRIMKIFL